MMTRRWLGTTMDVMTTVAADTQLAQLVALIRDRVRPELILLFGSRAIGGAREDSDYDLMLVLADGSDPRQALDAAYDAKRAAALPVDLLVRTASDYARMQHDPGFLDWLVSRQGVLLYSSGSVPQRGPAPLRVRETPREGLEMRLRLAEIDFRTATMLFEAEPVLAGPTCFHCHECLEKLLKALIVRRGEHPPRTHSLVALLELQDVTLQHDAALREDCTFLDLFYPASRYPDTGTPEPTDAVAVRAFEITSRLRDRLLPL